MSQVMPTSTLKITTLERTPCPIKYFPDIVRRWDCHHWIQREKVSGNTLMLVWKKKLHLVTSSLFRDLWRLTVSEKIQTSVIGLGLTPIWKESWNGFFKKCLQAFIAPQSANFAFLTFKLRLHPLPKVVDAHGHHRWIQREKMNKVLSYLKQKRLNSIGDMFLGSSSAPKGRTARRHLSPLSAWRDGRTDMCFLAHGCVVLLIGI